MPYRIERSDHFTRNIVGAKKQYYKKDDKGYQQFLTVVEEFLNAVEQNGWRIPGAYPEGWPHGTAESGWDFAKYYFAMPRLKGDAGQGRIMFVVHAEMLLAYPFWFYTHREYTKRPPDKEIAKLLNQAIVDAQAQQRADEAAETP